MNRLEMSRPAFCLSPEERERMRRLTRHLHARMAELEENGLEVREFREQDGLVTVAAPELENLAGRLRWNCGAHGEADGTCVKLWVSPGLTFEDLDALWGAVYDMLCE